MNASKTGRRKKVYDLVILIQSYPNLITAMNYALSRSGLSTLILVNGDMHIYKFLKQCIKDDNIEIKVYGNNIFLRSRLFSWALCLYVVYLHCRIPTYCCKEELITYGNWCDTGALFHHKISAEKITNLIANEESRYTIKSDNRKEFPLYIQLLNRLTDGMIERKHYYYKEDGQVKEINKDNFGIDPSCIQAKNVFAPRERSYELIEFDFKTSDQPFILYIEKNLLKTKATSFYKFIKINLSLYRMSRSNNLRIFVKFKPRDNYFFRRFFYRLIGFSILPAHVPAQFFAKSEKCACVVGFSSSSMSEKYGKKVYCFGSIHEVFNESAYKHVNSLKQRAEGSGVIFIKSLIDLEAVRIGGH